VRQTPKICTLREDAGGAVLVANLEEFKVASAGEMLAHLSAGSAHRAVGSTCMNATSSRSHAVFSIVMHSLRLGGADAGGEGAGGEAEAFVSRLHLVDLAGSERAKRTKAEGARLKEGININKGLLALGNVISALSDEEKRLQGAHVPYRDSKLTRMLQDSLGGNSRTLMIACVSPADSNFEETVNTLKYANRAKAIKNKAVVNREGPCAEVAALRAQVQALEALLTSGGQALPAAGAAGLAQDGGTGAVGSAAQSERIGELEREVAALKDEAARKGRRALALEIEADKLRLKLGQVCREHGVVLEEAEPAAGAESGAPDGEGDAEEREGEEGREGEEPPAPEEDGGLGWALSNAAMAEELHGLEEALSLKEQLLAQMTTGGEAVRADQAQLHQMQATIDELTREREALLQLGNQAAKVGDLEKQIAGLRHRVVEQERLLKVKHLTDRRVGQLSDEIDAMKGAKVQLLRRIKTEADKFREWRAEHAKEVALLKRQRSQVEYQNHKLQAQIDRQAGVLKRKMEENLAANSRIKALLQAKSAAKSAREAAAPGRDGDGGKGPGGDSLEAWLDAELKLCVEIRAIKALLAEQTAHRATLTREIGTLNETLAAPKGAEESAPAAKDDLKSRLAQLQNKWARRGAEPRERTEARLRAAQAQAAECSRSIGDLQRQLLEVEGNNDRERNVALNCPMLRSQQDAKRAVRVLFSVAARAQHRAADADAKLAEAGETEATLEGKVAVMQDELQVRSREHARDALLREQAAEEKGLALLTSLAGAGGEGGVGLGAGGGAVQEEVLRSLSELADERNELRREKMQMQQDLEEAQLLLKAKPAAPPKKVPAPRREVLSESEEEEEEEAEEAPESDDDEWVPGEARKRKAPGKDRAGAAAGRRGRTSAGSANSRESEGGASDAGASADVGRSPVPSVDKEKSWDAAEEAPPAIPPLEELQGLKVPALKDLCGHYGLKKAGKKEELIQRLAARAREAAAPAPPSPPAAGGAEPVSPAASAAGDEAQRRSLSEGLSSGHVTKSRGSGASERSWPGEGAVGTEEIEVAVGVLRAKTPGGDETAAAADAAAGTGGWSLVDAGEWRDAAEVVPETPSRVAPGEEAAPVSASVEQLQALATGLSIASRHRQGTASPEPKQQQQQQQQRAGGGTGPAKAPAPHRAADKPVSGGGPMRSLTAHKAAAVPAAGGGATTGDLKNRLASLQARVPMAHKTNLPAAGAARGAADRTGGGKPVWGRPAAGPLAAADKPPLEKIYRPLHKLQPRPAP
jgi:hypothetical protein